MALYNVPEPFSVKGKADPRYEDLTLSEARSAERNKRWASRIIGGDLGDLGFEGYRVHRGRTYLCHPVLLSFLNRRLTRADVVALARQIVAEAMDSIGFEALG